MRPARFVIVWPAVGRVRVAAEVIDEELFSIESSEAAGVPWSDATEAAAGLADWDGVSVPDGWRLGSRSERRHFADLLDLVREFSQSGPGAPGVADLIH